MANVTFKNVFWRLLGFSPSSLSSSLYIGDFTCSENPDFALKILNTCAQEGGRIPTFEGYCLWFRESPYELQEPEPDDPAFAVYDPVLSDFERRVQRLGNFVTAQKEYEKTIRSHQKFRAQILDPESGYHPDVGGYLRFVCDPAFEWTGKNIPRCLAEDDRFFLKSRHSLHLREDDRERHTYITGKSGSGKSVTMETLIHRYLHNLHSKKPHEQNPAIILLDPHGDLARNCARLKINAENDRLVYLKPSLLHNVCPRINPFDIATTNWDHINRKTDALIEALKEAMRGDEEGSSFSPQMVTLLKPCIATLLHMEHTTFADLMRFMSDDRSDYEVYLNYAKRVLTNPSHLESLKNEFHKDAYRTSKLSIKTKVRNLLHDDYFYHFFVGPSTLDLEAEIERGAFIVFDLSNLSNSALGAMGRFLMASINSLVLSRAKLSEHQRKRTHIFVDECQKFVSPGMGNILRETRKFKLFGTFAQQVVGQGMDKDLRESIITNSGIKISGKSGHSSLAAMSKEHQIPVEEIANLGKGQFHIKAGDSPSIKVKIPMLRPKDRMDWPQWRAMLEDQVKRYYRPIFAVNTGTETPQQQPDGKDATATVQEADPAVSVAQKGYARKARNPFASSND